MAVARSRAAEHDHPAIPLRCSGVPDARARVPRGMTSLRALLDEAATRAAAGSIDDALAAYAEVLARAPSLPEAHYNVAALQLAKGDLTSAEASLHHATRLKPGW